MLAAKCIVEYREEQRIRHGQCAFPVLKGRECMLRSDLAVHYSLVRLRILGLCLQNRKALLRQQSAMKHYVDGRGKKSRWSG